MGCGVESRHAGSGRTKRVSDPGYRREPDKLPALNSIAGVAPGQPIIKAYWRRQCLAWFGIR